MIGGGGSPSHSETDESVQGPISPAEFKQLFELVASLFPQSRAESERPPPPGFIIDNDENVSESSYARFALYE